ncbi:Protein ssuh2 [Bulinus truncatus]|nr:Protein ssuh2 [Bulinus truncatus]
MDRRLRSSMYHLQGTTTPPDFTSSSTSLGCALPHAVNLIPAFNSEDSSKPIERPPLKSFSSILEDEAIQALQRYISETSCLRKRPIQEMQIDSILPSNIFHYSLETFAEARSAQWTYEPYNGEPLACTGPSPDPWSVQVPGCMFQSSQCEMELPNTSRVRTCKECSGGGTRICLLCLGTGKLLCQQCSGSGILILRDGQFRNCCYCTEGWYTCRTCRAIGRTECTKCQGRGDLRWFVLMTIKRTNLEEDYILHNTSLLWDRIKKASGKLIFEETGPRVWPVNDFPEEKINIASQNLISKHRLKFESEVILMQRHNIRVIPITEVKYFYKGKTFTYYVYGNERRVYSDVETACDRDTYFVVETACDRDTYFVVETACDRDTYFVVETACDRDTYFVVETACDRDTYFVVETACDRDTYFVVETACDRDTYFVVETACDRDTYFVVETACDRDTYFVVETACDRDTYFVVETACDRDTHFVVETACDRDTHFVVETACDRDTYFVVETACDRDTYFVVETACDRDTYFVVETACDRDTYFVVETACDRDT